MKTVEFFNACNDTAAVEARGDDPLKKLIEDMGGWNVTGNMKSLSSMSVTQRIGKVSSELFIKPFIDVKVFIDPHDSNKHILQVSWGRSRSFITRKTDLIRGIKTTNLMRSPEGFRNKGTSPLTFWEHESKRNIKLRTWEQRHILGNRELQKGRNTFREHGNTRKILLGTRKHGAPPLPPRIGRPSLMLKNL